MSTTTVNEPKVSVHGIPKSQYDSGAGDPTGGGGAPEGGGGGILQHFKDHWQIYTIAIGFATVGIMLLIYYKSNNAVNSSMAAPGDSSTTGSIGTGSSPDQLWGSQLDADYQQLMYNQNTTVGLLQQILNSLQNPTTSPPTGTPGGGNPPPTQPPGGGSLLETIRARFNSPITKNYDQANPGGVPIRSSPTFGNDIIGLEPYGASFTVKSLTPVSGGNNFGPGNTNGSTQWFQLPTGGYVSAYDVSHP